MATEQFVDVTYRGLEIGSTVKLRELGPTTAYVELTTPMPVGTSLMIATDTGVTFGARVLRVQEQVAGAEHPPGMRIAAELEGAAADWWKPLVDSEDPVIPEPTVEVRAPADGSGDGGPAEAAGEAAEAAAEDAPAEAEEDAGVGGAPAAEPGEPKQKKSSRTQVMDVAEIQAAIAAGGDVADIEAAVPTPVEGRATDRMDAVDIEAIEADAAKKKDDDNGSGKKKKRRRRRRKKKDSGS
jgi:hypothetical protein